MRIKCGRYNEDGAFASIVDEHGDEIDLLEEDDIEAFEICVEAAAILRTLADRFEKAAALKDPMNGRELLIINEADREEIEEWDYLYGD